MDKVVIKTDEEVVDSTIQSGGKTDNDVVNLSDNKGVVDKTKISTPKTGDVVIDKPADVSNVNQDDTNEVEGIEIDGVEYSLDKEGNALDETGAIKFTKAEMDAFEEAPTESAVSLLAKTTNIIPIGNDGKPIEYPDDDTGLAQYVSDVYEQGRTDETSNVYNSLYSKYPILQGIINHLELNNGDLTDFNNSVSYSNVEVNKKDEAQMKNIIFAARKMRGESDDKINKYYNYLKDSDVDLKAVISEATDELTYLKGVESEEAANIQKQLEDKTRQQEEEAKDYWGIDVVNGKVVDLKKEGSVYSSIKSGKLKVGDSTYNLPDKIRIKDGDKVEYKTRDDFFNYLYQPVSQIIDGKKVTQTKHITDMQNEINNRGVSDDIFDAFKRFVKYDTSQFIKEQINQDKVRTISRRITTKGSNTSSTNRTNQGKKIVIKQ